MKRKKKVSMLLNFRDVSSILVIVGKKMVPGTKRKIIIGEMDGTLSLYPPLKSQKLAFYPLNMEL
jgi:hypothetical protein